MGLGLVESISFGLDPRQYIEGYSLLEIIKSDFVKLDTLRIRGQGPRRSMSLPYPPLFHSIQIKHIQAPNSRQIVTSFRSGWRAWLRSREQVVILS